MSRCEPCGGTSSPHTLTTAEFLTNGAIQALTRRCGASKGGGGGGSGGGAGGGGGGGGKDPRGYEGPTSVTHGDGVTPNAKANAKPGAITGPSGVDIGSAGGTGTGGSGGPGGDVDGVAGEAIGEGGTPGANAGAGASTGSTEGGDGGGGSGTGGQASDSLDTAIATAGVLLGDHVDFEKGKGGNHGVPGGSGDGSGSRLGQYLYLAKAALTAAVTAIASQLAGRALGWLAGRLGSLARGPLGRLWRRISGKADDAAKGRGGPGSGLAGQTREQLLKSQKSFEKLIAEHQQKLADFKANPLAHDNKGLLKNAPTDEIRQKIIEGRIKVLEGQLAKQQGELAKIKKLLGD